MSLLREYGSSIPVNIAGIGIGHGYPCRFIAEIGSLFPTAEEGAAYVDAAIRSGADFVKIHTFKARNYVTRHVKFDLPVMEGRKIDPIEFVSGAEFPDEEHRKLFAYCMEKGIPIFSEPSHEDDVDFLMSLEVPAIELSPEDANNIPLIRYVGRKGIPLILATGACTMEEVWEAADSFYSTGNRNLVLLHGVRYYPADAEEMNASVILTMQKEFPDAPVGIFDLTSSTHPDEREGNEYAVNTARGLATALLAVGLGVDVVEKKLTTSKYNEGPDHVVAATPEEYKLILDTTRTMEKAYGDGVKRPSRSELLGTRIDDRKSVFANADIPTGTVLTEEMVCVKRPGNGLPPKFRDRVTGRRTMKALQKDDYIRLEDLE